MADSKGDLVFWHSPNTRSTGARIVLEELGAPHEMRALNMKMGERRKAAYLAVNPLGKVPAIVHEGALVTEQGAIFLFLADLFPEAAWLQPAAIRGAAPTSAGSSTTARASSRP
jgi:glutathione S-transferase